MKYTMRNKDNSSILIEANSFADFALPAIKLLTSEVLKTLVTSGLLAIPLMLIWNWLVPEYEMTYAQALAFRVMCKILF